MEPVGTKKPTQMSVLSMLSNGTFAVTVGVEQKGRSFVRQAKAGVVGFSQWSPVDDPHKLHDAGRFICDGAEVHFRMFYFKDHTMANEVGPCADAYRLLLIALPEELR